MPPSGGSSRSSSRSGTKSERSGCSRSGRSRRWIGSRSGSGSGWGSRRDRRDRRLRRLPREGTKRFSPYGQGLRAGRAGLRRMGRIVSFLREEGDEGRSEEHTSELQSQSNLVCRLLLEKKKKI